MTCILSVRLWWTDRITRRAVFSVLGYIHCVYHDCAATDNLIIKYADDTAIIGLINSNDESSYKSEVENVVRWSENNNLTVNSWTTYEMVTDFSKKTVCFFSPVFMNGSEVQIVESCKFLGVTLSKDLSWQQLFFYANCGNSPQTSRLF